MSRLVHPLEPVRHALRAFKDAVIEGRFDEALLDETAWTLFVYFHDQPMSRKEAAAFLGVSLPTFDKLRRQGLVIEHFHGRKRKWARPYFLRGELVVRKNAPHPGLRRYGGQP